MSTVKQQITLKEYDFLTVKEGNQGECISTKNFEVIENFVLANEQAVPYLKITTKKGYGKVLQAQNYVGVLQTKDGTTIEILPKIREVDTNTFNAYGKKYTNCKELYLIYPKDKEIYCETYD